jgi:hypothetical protein
VGGRHESRRAGDEPCAAPRRALAGWIASCVLSKRGGNGRPGLGLPTASAEATLLPRTIPSINRQPMLYHHNRAAAAAADAADASDADTYTPLPSLSPPQAPRIHCGWCSNGAARTPDRPRTGKEGGGVAEAAAVWCCRRRRDSANATTASARTARHRSTHTTEQPLGGVTIPPRGATTSRSGK